MTGSTRLARLIIALTATVAVGVGGSLAVATSASASKKPKSSIETPSAGTVTETGSTLLYPLFNLWAGGYSTKYSSVTVSTAGTGSGTATESSSASIRP